MQHTTETPKQYQCRHIFTDGRRCSSPCLRQQEFCYYHHTTRKPIANPKQRRSRCSTFHLPLPEDRSAIQASIGEVLQRIAANDIDPRRAGLLLYGLQIASLNLPKPQPTQRNAKPEPIQTVEEITIDPALGVLAPRAEVSEITKRKSSVAQLLERMMQSEETPTILPTLQAADESCVLASDFIKRNISAMQDPYSSETRLKHSRISRGEMKPSLLGNFRLVDNPEVWKCQQRLDLLQIPAVPPAQFGCRCGRGRRGRLDPQFTSVTALLCRGWRRVASLIILNCG